MNLKTCFIVLVFLGGFFSCKNEKGTNIPLATIDENGYLNLLEYKIGSANNYDSIVKVDFSVAKIKLKTKNTYQIVVKIMGDFETYNNYYVLLNFYPHDNELNLLKQERKKYGFESFSAEILNNNDELYISREIKTKISSPRAITISLISYKNKNKIKEIVLQNVNFIK